jgi:phosphate butyryltransferase
MALKDYAALAALVKGVQKKTAVVVAAHDDHVLDAVLKAHAEGYIDYILVGNKAKILEIGAHEGAKISESQIVETDDDAASAETAVRLIREKQGSMLIKGKLETATLLRACFDKEKGIRTGKTMCNIAFHQMAQYPKLLGLTDGGVTVYPTLEQKADMIKNSMELFTALGYKQPRFAVLCATETVNEKIVETTDAAALKERCAKGEFGDCIVEGPISWDLMWSKEAAEIKGYKSPVTGDTDMLIAPNIAAGNLVSKCMLYVGPAQMAGCMMGAQVPLTITSRAASADEKHYSILLAAAVGNI